MDDPGQVADAVARRSAGVRSPLVVLGEDDDGRLAVLDSGGDAVDATLLAERRLEDLVIQHDRAVLRASQEAAREHREQRACQVRLSVTGSRERWFEVRYLPGVADGLLVLLRDVTDLRRIAAEAEVLRRVTELANSITDADEAVRGALADLRESLGWRAGRVLRLNEGRLAPTGAWSTGEDAQGLPPIVEEVAAAGTPVARRAAADGAPAAGLGAPDVPDRLVDAGVTTVVAVPVTVDGEVTQVLEFHTGEPLPDEEQLGLLAQVGQQLGWVGVRQRSLAALERSHEELARSNAELERFAYVASHDLQEPLRKIIGFTELLEHHHDPLDDDEAEYRSYVIDSAQRLQRLIKDLLAYSRAGRRELAAEPVDLGTVTGQVLEDLAPAIDEADATVEVGDLPVVLGDDGQLREVIQNLVSNALKYRSEDRAPRIAISGEDDADDGGPATAGVVVADNGIGIAAGHRSAVFEVFRRLHPAHAYGGTGLGLAMVERIVNRHGGNVWITDSPFGDGIAVHLTLPRAQEQP